MVMLMGDPRAGAFMGPNGHAQSDSEGRFSIADVTPGTYRLHASVPMRMDPPGASAAGGIGAVSVSGGFSSFSSWSIDSSNGVGGGSAPSEIVVSEANVTGVRVTIKR